MIGWPICLEFPLCPKCLTNSDKTGWYDSKLTFVYTVDDKARIKVEMAKR